MDQKDITQDMHNEFYSFIGGAFDNPRYQLHYKADAPINIRALFYVPEYKPSKCNTVISETLIEWMISQICYHVD